MKKDICLCIALSAVAGTLAAMAAPDAVQPAKKTPPPVVLKMDDLKPSGSNNAIPARWKAFVDACDELGVKASLGLIGNGLENPSPEFVAWAKKLHDSGRFQLWNHGYTHAEYPKVNGRRHAEFIGEDVATQRASAERTQKLAKDKLGITLTAFGTPFNVMDENTDQALSEIPEIREWFFGPDKPKAYKGVVLPRRVNLEHPTMNPSAAGLIADFNKNAATANVLVLQGHPGGWSDERLAEFRKAVAFLKEQGCEFLTAAEYAKRIARR
jgi:peptidoglycan/xylan/chitin deacetylase (PgdA/CDA1 family)